MVIATAIPKSTGNHLLHGDFEQSRWTLGNVIVGDWKTKVVDGNGLLEVYSPPSGGPGNLPLIDFGSGAWTNYLFGFRFKVTECNPIGFFGCTIVITFRSEAGQAYVLLINTNVGEVNLEFGDRENWTEFNHGITNKSLDLSLGTWHNVLLAVDRESISAAVDGTWTSAVSDDRLKTGSVGIAVGINTTAQFDDFDAWTIP
jgi:hypothetical protein